MAGFGSTTVVRPARRPTERGGGRARTPDEARRLRDILRSNVFAGAYPEGLLPPESALMLTHAAPRAAVREALTMLRDEGVVERVQGIGTFVVAERHIGSMDERHSTGPADGQRLLYRTRAEVLDCSVVPAPDAVALHLGLDRGARVLRLEYLSHLGGDPIGVATNYVAFPEAEAIADAPFHHDWYTMLKDAGVGQGGSEWVMSAVNADPTVAGLLQVRAGAALMAGEELIWDLDGRPFDFAIAYVRTDRLAFHSREWTVRSRSAAA
jgi:GntR family transcriptional regulator